jgi:alkanesulfonate monooxygenase SsuD/methylene tetrahydromethanopterin reductase-like flavin-dependent oxidoreductase (luciferase family)
MADGSETPFDHKPSVEDSIDQQMMAIGSVEEVADLMGRYRDEVGVEHFVLFFDMPGLTQEEMDNQLEMTATEVLPRIGVTLGS